MTETQKYIMRRYSGNWDISDAYDTLLSLDEMYGDEPYFDKSDGITYNAEYAFWLEFDRLDRKKKLTADEVLALLRKHIAYLGDEVLQKRRH